MSERATDGEDEFGWLEEVTGDEALAWVRERNAGTVADLAAGSRYDGLRAGIREVLDADDRIPYITRRGDFRYNFWRDAAHPRGLWRRTTLASYRTAEPEWDVLLDLDALADAEGENWVWDSAQVLRPAYERALVQLSRGGADATVVREFDLVRREFVADGFTLPEAKTFVDWIDADRVYVGTDTGPGSLTNAGLPRTVREWRRGTPVAEAPLVFEGKPDDTYVTGHHDDTEGYERDFVRRGIDFYRDELYLRDGDTLTRIDLPDDAIVTVQREWLLVELRTPWRGFPAGALLATGFDAYVAGEDPAFVPLFEPDPHTALAGYSWTRHHLILTEMHDVSSRLTVLTPRESGPWHAEPLAGVPELGTASAHGTDADVDDEYLLEVTGFLTPTTLSVGTIGAGAEPVKHAPAYFDATGLVVRQHFAVSADGTRVPYFVVGPDTDGPLPTVLYGYGGFEVPWQPTYSGTIGRAWLSRGHRYVLANIRGGGEYGPTWHSGAVRENRRLVYEDFAAVATDLVSRGLTTAPRLGIHGGSNGGLLVSVMLTRHPELFGAAVSQVPLTDMRRYHRLLAGALWVAEYGDPDEPDDWAFMREFSPYHQVRPDAAYPPVLYTTSTRDDRVHPAHARKMVARLLAQGHDVTYYENIEGGHGGAADNAQAAFVSALVYEFFARHLT
ncbi:prolyl oligopeptidase family serine peptidase [Actinocatenispora rupis]|uniref:Prolyl oligopeptidase n=1 Tax=Actinocatenispora rupis TaxID=519421 RepID=A0A8J3IZV4_9ACTN|nr:prolyl oligopeptidase family serine peptidase [Actinocatenispora rupis]GID11633.1 prolyl oligopeptidase [Actinocatenispora rupis]